MDRPEGFDEVPDVGRDDAGRVVEGNTLHQGHGKYADVATTETILNAIRAGAPFAVAARSAGVHTRTFRRWRVLGEAGREPYATLLRNVEQAMDQAHVHALAIIRQAMPAQWYAAAWYLERRHPELYAKTERHEISGPGGAPVKLEAVRSKVMDEIERISRQLDPIAIDAHAVVTNGNGNGNNGHH